MSCIHQNAEVILEAFIARIRTAETFKEIKNVQVYQNTLYAQGDITKYRKVLEEIFKETYPALKNVEDIFIVEENTSSLALNISPEFSKVYEDIFTNKLLKEKAEYDKKGYKNGNFTIFKNIDTVPFLLAADEFRALQGESYRYSNGRVVKEFVRDYSSSPAALEKLKRKFGRSNVEYSKTFKDGMYVNKVQVLNPVLESYSSNKQLSLFLSPEVNYQLKAVDILMSDKAKQIFAKGEKAKWDLNKILTELQIPKEQKQLLLDLGITDREQLALELASNYSYTVEINTAKTNEEKQVIQIGDNEEFTFSGSIYEFKEGEYLKDDEIIDIIEYESAKHEAFTQPNTQYYANLTVPGGINYTENEISTPLITPSIKGHAEFSTYNGIGWFRSDEQIKLKTSEQKGFWNPDTQKEEFFEDGTPEDTKTRRILELQSDLFQKGRDKKDLVTEKYEGVEYVTDDELIKKLDNEVNPMYSSKDSQADPVYIENIAYSFDNKGWYSKKYSDVSKENQFLQLLNKNNNWVTFFIKSIIQDSAKKGYEKVLFPKGETAAKIEGHETIADEIQKKNDDIQFLQKAKENPENYIEIEADPEEGTYENYSIARNSWIISNTDKAEFIKSIDKRITNIEQQKANLKSQGIEKLKPIEAFYEIRVGNILEKQFGKDNVKTITDKYGNQWREITIVAERDLGSIHLSPEVQDDFSSIWDDMDKGQEEDMIAMGIIKEPSKVGIEKEDNLKPYFETLLNTKLDLIRRIESKLDRLKTEKKRNKNNTEVLKSLNNEIEKYEEILEGSEITKGLKTQYQELKMTPALDKFLMYAEAELSRVDDLMESERFEDTLEAKVILDFYSRINPEVEIENNTLFAKEDILDSAGNIDLTPETLNKLRDLSTQAIAKQAQIEKVQREKILERINELSKVTEVYQNPLDEQDIFFSDTGLKDVTWFDMMMYDGQHNTFSQGDILRQTAQMLLEEEINKEEFWARDMDNRVKNIKDRLAKRLAKLGIKNSSIFMAKDSGFKTRRLISRETQKYFDKRNIAIYAKLRERNKEIALMEDFQRRQSGRINLAREILDWKRGNEIVLDVNAIEEIQKLFPEFSDYFKDSQGIAEHLQELERNYGNTPQAKRELDKMIKEQITKIQEYKLAHDTFLEDLLEAENVTKIEDLSEGAEIEYINWVNFNSPFVYANDFQTFEVRYQQGSPGNTVVPIVPQFKYNSFIPRKYEAEVDIIEKKIIEKTTETGYYDNDFSIIENDEVLLEFYDILRELVDYIYKNIPYEEQKNFNPFEIISVDKTLMETLNDPDVKGLTVVSKFFQWIMDWMKRNITEKPRSIVSNLAKNPITSEEEYKVNADFLKFASKAVQHKSTVEAVRLKQILGLDYNDNLSRVMSTNDITQSVLDYYSNLLGETITKQDIKNKFGSEYNPYKFLQKILLHNESQNYSSDLPKIVSYYSKVAAIYAGRQRALPLLTSIKREYEKIKTVRTNPQGIPLENAPSDINANLRTKANTQFSSWFNRAVLGEYSSKNEFGTVKKVRKLRFTSNEKENVQKIDKLLKDLAADRERLIKTPSKKSTQELMAITKIEENLLLAKQNMGSVITGASIMDGIFKFLRFKGLGWNLNGAITNFFEGQIANIIAAAKNQSFSEESFWRAIGVIRESNFKNLSFGKFSTKDSRKARIIMDNYDILQDMTNELQKSSNKSVYSGLNRYLPFELIRRIEYMNQTPVALAILMDTQIKNDKGETSSVWDALDEYGKLLPEFATETNKYNWEILSREETSKIEQNNPGIKRNQYNATKYTIIETLVNLHGDYHDLRGMMASEFISGKALLMFKRWWGMQVFSRFATEQMHLGLGRKVKGRYRSLSAGQLANYGALIGGIFAGPLGAGVGAATLGTIGKFAGIERSTNAQVKSNLYLISEMFLVTKDMILKMIGIPVNAIAGKQLVKTDSKWLNSSGYSKIDIENIKGNIAEMSLLLGMTALMLIVKGLRGYGREDEDDEGLIKETTHNFLVNKIMQLADQTLSYNPYGIVEDMTSADAISCVRFMYDNALLVRDFANMLQGEGTILGGPNKGEERFLIQLRRTYLPSIARDGFGFGASMERQYLPSPFDDISRSTEKNIDREILKLRSKYQNRLESNLTDLGFTEEQVDKKVKEKMKKLHKKKKESKKAQLKRIKKVVDK